MNNIEWLFFDVASTLMNEEKAYLHRLHDIADTVNERFEKIYDRAISFYKENRKGDWEIMKLYGLSGLKWHQEDEKLYDDAIEVLSKKYKIGIIANQSLGTVERLEEKGILRYIDLVIASAEEGVSKPDRKIFDIALSRANCKPEKAVMIGDRVDNDIVPAKKLGMKTIWIKQAFGKYWNVSGQEEQADYEINDLTDLLYLCL